MDFIDGKNIIITGGTGLIGSTLVRLLSKRAGRIILPVRNTDKAKNMFSGMDDNIEYIEADMNSSVRTASDVDYIIHGAAPTDSRFFIEHPVETILTIVDGCRNMLDLAVKKSVKGFVFLSTMEVYGSPQSDEFLYENMGTNLDTQAVRSSYPEAKRLCENLCSSYASQYGIRCMSVRLAQSFGPGVKYDDNRVFAEFARCVMEKKNIVLKTKGSSRRSYIYTEDAARAILTVLQKGKSGEVYNAANEDTYCSIVEMAHLVADKIALGTINVCFDIDEEAAKKFVSEHRLRLSSDKLKALGFKAECGLEEMYKHMIRDMQK